MKIRQYEGGIPYETEVPEPPAGFMAFLDSIPCSCKGEAHDECHVCADCGGVGALNEVQDDPDGSGFMWLCDECYESAVEADEIARRAEKEDEAWDFAAMREDHEAMKFDAWWQEQKESRS